MYHSASQFHDRQGEVYDLLSGNKKKKKEKDVSSSVLLFICCRQVAYNFQPPDKPHLSCDGVPEILLLWQTNSGAKSMAKLINNGFGKRQKPV